LFQRWTRRSLCALFERPGFALNLLAPKLPLISVSLGNSHEGG
jgi:hypothetical protein